MYTIVYKGKGTKKKWNPILSSLYAHAINELDVTEGPFELDFEVDEDLGVVTLYPKEDMVHKFEFSTPRHKQECYNEYAVGGHSIGKNHVKFEDFTEGIYCEFKQIKG